MQFQETLRFYHTGGKSRVLVRSKEISKAMRHLRLLSDIPIADMAKHLGVQQVMIWRYEQGHCGLRFDTLIRLARLATTHGHQDFAATFIAPISSEMGTTPQYLLDGIRRAA